MFSSNLISPGMPSDATMTTRVIVGETAPWFSGLLSVDQVSHSDHGDAERGQGGDGGGGGGKLRAAASEQAGGLYPALCSTLCPCSRPFLPARGALVWEGGGEAGWVDSLHNSFVMQT